MAISHIESTTGSADATSFTVTISSSTLTDDILLLSVAHESSTSPSVSDDDTGGNTWTEKVQDEQVGVVHGSLWWKRATSGTAGKTITVSSVTAAGAGVCAVYRGALSSGDPIEASISEGNFPGDETMAEITPTTNGAEICLSICKISTATVSSQSTTDPGSLTEHAEIGQSGGTNAVLVSFASANQTTAAATGNFTWVQSNTNGVSIGAALTPASEDSGIQALEGLIGA